MGLDKFGLFNREVSKLEGEDGYLVNVSSAGALQVGGEVTFPSAQSVNATLVGTSDVNISSQSGSINVDASGATVPISAASDLDVNITNSTVGISGSVTFPSAQQVSIADASIAVTQSGDFNIADVDEVVLLPERWQQNPSSVVSAGLSNSGGVDETLYTVTGGKTLYVSTLYLASSDTSGTSYIKDNGSGGTTKLTLSSDIATKGVVTVTFKPPLVFSTDVRFDFGTLTMSTLRFSGWEE